MPDDQQTYRKFTISAEQAAAAGKDIESMSNYLRRFVVRLRKLHVDTRDPLLKQPL